MTSRTLSARLNALEKQQGAEGRTIIVWRGEDEADFQRHLAEAEKSAGPNDIVQVVGWMRGGCENDEFAQF